MELTNKLQTIFKNLHGYNRASMISVTLLSN